MASMTILTGLVLIVLGGLGYEAASHGSAALLPAYFGIVLGVLGSMARTNSAKIRMIVMHIAVTAGVVGFFVSVSGIWDYVQMERGVYFADPTIVEYRAATAVVLLIFVLLCVRSFIKARRTREAAPAGKLAGGARRAS